MTDIQSDVVLDSDVNISSEIDTADTLGSLLKNRRQSLGISLDEISSELNLKVSLLQDIENNSLSLELASTYTRGYIRNYASHIGLSVDKVQGFLDLGFKDQRKFQNFSEINQPSSKKGAYLLFFTVSVLLGGLGWFYRSAIISLF